MTMIASKTAFGSLSIVLLIRALGAGGAERQLVSLAIGLSRRGHSVKVVTFYAGGALEGELQSAGLSLIDLGKRGRWDLIGFFFRLARLINEARPDVVYTFMDLPNILIGLLKPIVRHSAIIWGVRASDIETEDWVAAWVSRAEALLARQPDLIIANSCAGKKWVELRGFRASRVTVIPNGIDVDRFRRDEIARSMFRKEWKIDADALLVGVLGRLAPMKGHLYFLQAAKKVLAKVPQTRFVCIGGGDDRYYREMKRVAADLGLSSEVIWTGRYEKPAVALAGIDILCVPSIAAEGFSNALGEAMATGIPCVVTDLGDSAFVVGETGVVVPPRDAGALADGIIALYGRLGANLSSAVRERICRSFTIDHMVSSTEAALAGVVENRPRRTNG